MAAMMTILLRPRLATALLQQKHRIAGLAAQQCKESRRILSTEPLSSRLEMVSPDMDIGTSGTEDEENKKLLHPDDFGPIPYPKHLSPSSAMTFKDCPQSFLFQYLYKIKQPTNQVLAKGTMCHSALEHVFDLDPKERTLENLQNLLRVEWAENRLEEEYRFLFETEGEVDVVRDIEAEKEWGQSALQLLENYYESEDPKMIQRPNPHKREVWVSSNLALDPSVGVTSENYEHGSKVPKDETFRVRGIIDRVDIVRESSRKVALKIIDYKTGKAPNLKYSPAMNQKIFNEKFYQLKIYALLMREKTEASTDSTNDVENNMDLRYLKLHFLNSEEGKAKPWEMDLGATQEIRDAELNKVHSDLAQIWKDIKALVDTQDPKAFQHCDRPFCSCHTMRKDFEPGSVWDHPWITR